MANSEGSDDKTPFLTGLKEVVTALLALTLLALCAYMLVHTFNLGAQKADAGDEDAVKSLQDAFTRAKDVLLYALSLLGAVIGYYFGRVPAELHAQSAQKQANNAQNQLNQTQDKLAATTQSAAQAITDKKVQADEFKKTLSLVRSNLAQPSAAPVQAMRAMMQPSGNAQALAEIDEMMKRLD